MMYFMEDKAAERHTDCLTSMSAQMHEDAIQVLLYSSG